jgi:hypothetical protein
MVHSHSAQCRFTALRRVYNLLVPQLTAFFTSAPTLGSSAAVNSLRARAVGQMVPSSRFAVSLKPSVSYLELRTGLVKRYQE